MRIALIADIHGNQVALEAVLAEIRAEGVDGVVCLGDVASTGPRPRECVEILRDLGCPVVMGNADAELLDPDTPGVGWYRQQLGPSHLEFLRTFQPVVEIPLEGGHRLLCCHGSPRSNTDLLLPSAPPEDLDRLLGEVRATVVAGGHTHVQMLRRHRELLLVNPGSVGLPFDQNPWSGEVAPEAVYVAPWAEYALLTSEGHRLDVSVRRVPLDVAAVVASAPADWPQAADWCRGWRR